MKSACFRDHISTEECITFAVLRLSDAPLRKKLLDTTKFVATLALSNTSMKSVSVCAQTFGVSAGCVLPRTSLAIHGLHLPASTSACAQTLDVNAHYRILHRLVYTPALVDAHALEISPQCSKAVSLWLHFDIHLRSKAGFIVSYAAHLLGNYYKPCNRRTLRFESKCEIQPHGSVSIH